MRDCSQIYELRTKAKLSQRQLAKLSRPLLQSFACLRCGLEGHSLAAPPDRRRPEPPGRNTLLSLCGTNHRFGIPRVCGGRSTSGRLDTCLGQLPTTGSGPGLKTGRAVNLVALSSGVGRG